MSPVLAVALGAVVGAPLRYHLDRLVQNRIGSTFPWGTLLVNVLGCLVLGFLWSGSLTGALGPTLYTLLGTGFCGAFTTYSTFSFETLRLLESGAFRSASANVGGSLGAGLAAAFLGFALGHAIWPG
ncbi:fluoride efflux transporter CrcB [Actinopolymorpha pittospori]|uniref:Fluoride-specific ion channel FluC n=1 Tax=Actinopolymorpha pittospori TaxID=648752 RepID=A0A927N201_9ACTN|nr:fluoride efflux transporter CrcB [Actinopolymorpha pittospori]MBE1609488.1 CrcB protein [Actinopolymorpha pittospori]